MNMCALIKKSALNRVIGLYLRQNLCLIQPSQNYTHTHTHFTKKEILLS